MTFIDWKSGLKKRSKIYIIINHAPGALFQKSQSTRDIYITSLPLGDGEKIKKFDFCIFIIYK